MNVPKQYLGLTLAEAVAAQKEQVSPWGTAPFQWRSEYLPLIVGVVGVTGVFLFAGIMKKRKKKKRK